MIGRADTQGHRAAAALALLVVAASGIAAQAQDAAPPPPVPPVLVSTPAPPPGPTQAPAPPTPSPTVPPTPPQGVTPPPSPREADLEARLRRMEDRYDAMERRHAQAMQEMQFKYEAMRIRRTGAAALGPGPITGSAARSEAGIGAQGTGGRTNPRESGGGSGLGGQRTPREAGGIGAQGTDGRTFVREYTADEKPLRRPAKVSFSEGLEFASEDDEFKLTFHDLTQAEYRGFPRQDQGTLTDQFFLPRQRWYFTGQVTRSVEFYTAINRGYGSLDLLDAFITLNLIESLKNARGYGGRRPARRPGRGGPRRASIAARGRTTA